jgi:hypothetical protein
MDQKKETKLETKKLALKKISITKLGMEQLQAIAGGPDTAQSNCTSRSDTCPLTN